MIKSFEQSVNYLVENEWIKVNTAGFRKNQFEIVFDTSHYVELYSNNERIAESKITSVEDIIEFLNSNGLS